MNSKLKQLQEQKVALSTTLGELLDCRDTLTECIERVSISLDKLRGEIHSEIVCGDLMTNLFSSSKPPIDGGEQ